MLCRAVLLVLFVLQLVAAHGHRRWSEIAKHLPGRSGKQCRERFVNHMKYDRLPATHTQHLINSVSLVSPLHAIHLSTHITA